MQIVKSVQRKKTKPAQPRAVCRLSAKARGIRRRIFQEWDLDDSQVVLLDSCMSYLDECDHYKALLDGEGLSIVNDETGASRPHPGIAMLKMARQNYLQSWRMLDLRNESTKGKPGRPPANWYPEGQR